MAEVIITIEEGFVDFTIPITKADHLPDGTVAVYASGTTPEGEAGFRVDILPTWEHEVLDDGVLDLYWGLSRYHSLGPASDRFIAMLADAYGLPSASRTMAETIHFTAVGFGRDPRHITSSRQDMKFFFDKGDDETYAQVFTNIDLQQGYIEFREKDMEFRVALIAALESGNAPVLSGQDR